MLLSKDYEVVDQFLPERLRQSLSIGVEVRSLRPDTLHGRPFGREDSVEPLRVLTVVVD